MLIKPFKFKAKSMFRKVKILALRIYGHNPSKAWVASSNLSGDAIYEIKALLF